MGTRLMVFVYLLRRCKTGAFSGVKLPCRHLHPGEDSFKAAVGVVDCGLSVAPVGHGGVLSVPPCRMLITEAFTVRCRTHSPVDHWP